MAKFFRPHLNLGYAEDLLSGVNDLPELIEFNAEHNPDFVFGRQMRDGDGRSYHDITFSQLQQAVETCSAWLIASGVTKGRDIGGDYPTPVGILLGSDITIFIYMAALLRVGTPVLCLSARLTPVAVAHLLKATLASSVLYTTQTSSLVRDLEHGSLEARIGPLGDVHFHLALGYEAFLDAVHPSLSTSHVPTPYMYTARHELGAVIMHSSGTTGLPKPIYHTRAYVLGYAGCHQIPEPSVPFGYNISTLPLYHGFGLVAPSLSLSIGLPFVLPPASVIPTARTTLEYLKHNGSYSMLSVPSILEDILNHPDPDALRVLKALNFIAVGGAPMKETVGDRLLTEGVKLLSHWGATEIGAISIIKPPQPGDDWHYLTPRKDLGLEVVPLDPSDPDTSCRLIGHPLGWPDAFHVQDLLMRNPDAPDQIRILGRADELIVLATGEKIGPASLERTVAEHPQVKDVLAFGANRPSLGLIVELVEGVHEIGFEFMSSFLPYLERGNALTDAHGKVTSNMLVFTKPAEKPLVRTDKGSLARKENYVAFDEEISGCYEAAERLEVRPFPDIDSEKGQEGLRCAIRSFVVTCATTAAVDFSDVQNDSIDFFEMGMDSLHATRLRRMVQSAITQTIVPSRRESTVLPPDFCFQHPSIDKLCTAVASILSGSHAETESSRVTAMHAMLDNYVAELKSYEGLAKSSGWKRPTSAAQGDVVLLTGSTGSLGCMLLKRLSGDPCVRKVICLNRRRPGGSDSAMTYQINALRKRGLIMQEEDWEKVVLLESQTSMKNLGLDEVCYSQLFEVTHIVHNAWPVDFNRSLASFEPHVKALSNLVKLCLQSDLGVPKRILFASSVAVVGNYSISSGETGRPVLVPETEVDAGATDTFGYPEAKWVCEMMLQAANRMYGGGNEPSLRGSSIRIGQMTGPEDSGCWNETEHFPIICKTSQLLKALPDIDGSLSWIPVNRAALAICDLLFGHNFHPFYHLENPSRQPWGQVLENLSSLLSDSEEPPLPLIPFPEWVERAHRLSDDPSTNPVLKIMPFIRHDFLRMATGSVILDTHLSRSDSKTMAKSTPVEQRHLEEYCSYWRSVQFLT
ncbi:hypothetical protein V5O48_013694 [Marasmius crinis-equi]|uniref:Carrier domain-containing protein n=1 Tax=Marasmius crinis-equi TaxID=585013 RepID=A0ABR3EZE0_9AGAR